MSMTTQEAYERIHAHFSADGAVLGQLADGEGCVYRGPGGEKCAVGCLIDDEVFDGPPRYIYLTKEQVENQFGDGDRVWVTFADELNACGSLYNLNHLIFPQAEDLKELLNGESPEDQRKYEFLSGAQSEHDTAASVGEFLDKLDRLAEEGGLTVVTR